MSNRATILSTVLAMPAPASLLLPGRQLPLDVETLEPSKQRTRIWDLHHSLYCSIIGTCLTTAELRAILLRLGVQGAQTADDHGIHQLGVTLVSGPRAGAKHLQKALDRRHKLALNQCAKAKDVAAVAAFWDEAMKRGDIPGAYWAVLTHPLTTNELVKKVFGEVHMLSHLVGAANRADIRRLRQLEDDNATLAATLARQQRQLRDGFTARDETIRRLTDALARRAGEMVGAVAQDADTKALTDALAEREKRLSDEIASRTALSRRLDKLVNDLAEANRGRQSAERARAALVAELAAAEGQIERLMPAEGEGESLDLHQLCVLYVGGRSHQIPQLKGLVERTNGRFLHHDGGLEHNAALIPGLVSRADIALFPVDCISHDAAAAVKRSCRLMGKRYLPLRTASLACLLAGLVQARPSPANAS
jgi:Uncharacterized protein conserved in bacteria (DUF2325)